MAIESANVVGYQTVSTRLGYNYLTPTFRNVSGNPINIQELQLDSSVGPLEANLQFLADNSASASYYAWLSADMAVAFGGVEGKGGWFLEDDELGFVLPKSDVTLNPGDSVQIDAAEGKVITFSGQVSDADLAYYPTRAGYNYVGNAFPVAVDIQSIQLDADIGPLEANLQFLANNSASAAYYAWLSADMAVAFGGEEGKGGWFLEDDELGFVLPTPAVTLDPGAGIQIDVAANKTITILSPIEL